MCVCNVVIAGVVRFVANGNLQGFDETPLKGRRETALNEMSVVDNCCSLTT